MLKIFITISAIYTTMWAFQFENCDTFIGSCQNIDLCTVIDRMNNVTETTGTPSFQEQIDEILATPLGRHKECPIQTTSSTDQTVTIKLQPQSLFILKILEGDYMMKLIVKDAAASKEIIGCLKFNFSIVESPPTPPTPTSTTTTTLAGPVPPSESIPVG
ncbi:uncharacterized protein LOC123552282 isoform X2 [Mercenaria mercenaria]|uniref:uncharacterized protein LOC123552282 isoform X2 n=1 Tax=Mercenaria mercenaria TaxID=6596 RepID=UPI001E1D513D|nr:uncharacterized protein LOC123552282 isoform X2 [Mercenaria mercenaria]